MAHSKSDIIVIEEPTYRSPLVAAIHKRHGIRPQIFKDRRAPRAGTRNKQRDYRDEDRY